ncbi:MAG TPA: ribosomal protein L7/L12 [Gammaproteobacteria bacterium]|nr:ribosomal protein L7/L12 [Gammaproteobacteria bacterium]
MPADHENVSIPQEAMLAADRGDVIAAIKATREATGMGLEEAKDAVDAYSRGMPAGHSGAPSKELPLEAIASLHRGKLIDAIKHTRAKSGLGLKESKEAVELYLARNPNTQRQFQAATALERRGALRVVRMAILVAVVVLGYMWLTGTFGNAL